MASKILKKMGPVIIFLMIANFFISLTVSVFTIFNGQYFDDYKNYISLKNRNKYMEIDTLLFLGAREKGSSRSTSRTFLVQGKSLRDRNEIELAMSRQKYFSFDSIFPVYKSRLTQKYFLKNAPVDYYKSNYFSIFLGLYFKISLFPLTALTIYIIRKFRIYL